MDITVPHGRVEGRIAPPCSKSYAQRSFAAALLAHGESRIGNVGFCSDTRSALSCIEMLGADVSREEGGVLVVRGGLAPRGDVLYAGESGLAARLFTPIASLVGRPIRIEGCGTLLRRPMEMMIEPLRRMGVGVYDTGGRLPLEVCGPLRGGEWHVDGSVSSQFITGLLLALPLAEQETTLHVDGAVSIPYIDMTVETAARFGVEILHSDFSEFYIRGSQRYVPAAFDIEGDWSAAATMLVAGAIAGDVCVENISTLSLQADTAVCEALVRAGASVIDDGRSVTVSARELRGFVFDATHCPDLFPVLAALAAAAEGESVITGTSRLAAKESDRAEVLREEYAKLGVEVDLSSPDVMKIRGAKIRPAEVDSHGDHRIAMSLALSALRCNGGVRIRGAECVAKSYPAFFDDLRTLAGFDYE